MAKYTKVLACDGPARAGKTTLATNFEQKLGIPRISTGNIYRALTVLLLETLNLKTLKDLSEEEVLKVLLEHNAQNLKVTFTGEISLDTHVFSGLSAPHISANAWAVARTQEVRTQIVEPLVLKMVEDCTYPVVFSEGRDEGRLWKNSDKLGLAIFLSVDPLVAAMRERSMRIVQKQEVQSLLEIMSSLMRYDLDNATRNFKPTYVDDQLTVFLGKMNKEIKQAIQAQHQIVVPTSSIDAATVMQRVVRLASQAGLLDGTKQKTQTTLLGV